MHIVEFVVVAVALMAVVVALVGRRHTLGSVSRGPGSAGNDARSGDFGTTSSVFDSVALASNVDTNASPDSCSGDTGSDGGSGAGSSDGGCDGGGSD